MSTRVNVAYPITVNGISGYFLTDLYICYKKGSKRSRGLYFYYPYRLKTNYQKLSELTDGLILTINKDSRLHSSDGWTEKVWETSSYFNLLSMILHLSLFSGTP